MTSAIEGEPELLSQNAYLRLQDMIVKGELAPGEMLSENTLRGVLECGRTPVREALQRLQYEGFVEIHPRRGAMVTSIDIHKQLELLEVRRPLEDLMVRLAARRARNSERAEMRELADQLEHAVAEDDRQSYLSINRRTHEVEARATRNRQLITSIGQLHRLSRRFWYSFITETKTFSRAAEHHQAILRSIADAEPANAASHTVLLMDLLEHVTRSTIEDRIDL